MRRYLLDTNAAGDYINRRHGVRERAIAEVLRGNRLGIACRFSVNSGLAWKTAELGTAIVNGCWWPSLTGRSGPTTRPPQRSTDASRQN